MSTQLRLEFSELSKHLHYFIELYFLRIYTKEERIKPVLKSICLILKSTKTVPDLLLKLYHIMDQKDANILLVTARENIIGKCIFKVTKLDCIYI